MSYLDLESTKIRNIEIKQNDVLKIKGKKYEVIKIMEDSECLPPKYEFRDMLSFDLLEKGSKRITPTHFIAYYLDTKEIFFSGNKLEENDLKVIS